MILSRYLIRELLQVFLVLSLVLLSIVSSNMLVHYLSVAVNGGMSFPEVLKLIGVLVPQYLVWILPFGWFITVVFVYGKLFAQKELLVMFAGGMSWTQLLKLTLMPATAIALLVGVLSLYVVPEMNVYQNELKSSAGTNDLSVLRPERFMFIPGQSAVAYVGKLDASAGRVFDFFMYMPETADRSAQVITAPEVVQRETKSQDTYLEFDRGHLYRYPKPGHGLAFLKVDYQKHFLKVDVPHLSLDQTDVSTLSTFKLFRLLFLSQQPKIEAAEMQFRCSLPISVLLLTGLGVLLSYVPPRRSRYLKLMPAVLCLCLYFNFLTINRLWMENGTLSVWLGLLGFQGLVLGVIVIWLGCLDRLKFFRALRFWSNSAGEKWEL